MSLKKSKGAILVRQKQKLVIDYFQLPKRLYRGQVLVKIKLTGICGSQIGEIAGVKGPDKFLPHLLGHEGVARVIDMHESVKKIKKNDRVILHWMKSKGIDAEPPRYIWKGKRLNAGKITTFNQYAVISENRLTKIPKKISDIDAVFLGCTASTAIGSILKVAKLKKIKKKLKVVISGCGLIGQYILKFLQEASNTEIVVLENNRNKLKIAKKIGAKTCIDPEKFSLKNIEKRYLNSVDYFFECSGNVNLINLGFKLIKSNGKLITIGVSQKGKLVKFDPLEINLGKKILGSKGGNFNPELDLKNFFTLSKKKFNHKSMIEGVFNFKDINSLINKITSRKISKKVLIKF